jgi:hypothetical protein
MRPLSLTGSAFAHLWQSPSHSITSRVYTDPESVELLGRRIAALSGPAKHALCCSLLREADGLAHPGARFDDEAREGYDWQRDDVKVAVRSSQLAWQMQGNYTGRWVLSFSNVRLASEVEDSPHHELQLAVVTPDGIEIWRHDRRTGVGHAGRLERVQGKRIMMYGKVGVRGWRAAHELWIRPKLQQGGCMLLESVPYVDGRMSATFALNRGIESPVLAAFARAPMAELGPGPRRAALAKLVKTVDRQLHPKATFAEGARRRLESPRVRRAHASIELEDEDTNQGQFLGRHWEKECSWRRDGQRVTVRSAQMNWEASHCRWRFLFSGIRLPATAPRAKGGGVGDGGSVDGEGDAPGDTADQRAHASLDELLLALYTPRGCYVYRHDLSLGLTRTGRVNALQGFHIKLHGPVREESWAAALDGTILPKLDAACERLAFVAFENAGS